MRGTYDTGARDGVPRLRGIQEITDAEASARPLATLVMNTASVVDRDHGSRPEAQDPVTDRKSLYNGHAPTAGSAPIATLLVPAPLCAATSGSGVLARAPGAGGDSLLGRGQASLTGGMELTRFRGQVSVMRPVPRHGGSSRSRRGCGSRGCCDVGAGCRTPRCSRIGRGGRRRVSANCGGGRVRS